MQQENSGYDTFDSIVVAAHTEDDAKEMHPYGAWRKNTSSSVGEIKTFVARNSVWASSPEKVTVQLLGVAEPDIEPGIILSSFNAG